MKYAIVMPAYNAATTIQETLQSFQRCQPEINTISGIYLTDDHSFDNTVELAQTIWQSSQPPLIIYRLPQNSGQWVALNNSIRRAIEEGADWVLCLHADDIAKDNWLRQMFAAIEQAPTTVASVCSSYDVFYPDGRVVPGENNLERSLEIVEGSPAKVRHTLQVGCWWHISGCAIRSAAFHSIGDFDQRYAYYGDWDWLLRAQACKWAISYIPLSLIDYRQHEASVSSRMTRNTTRIEEQIDLINKFSAHLSRRDHLRWHILHAYFAVRRVGRDILTQNKQGLVNDLQSLNMIIKNGLLQIIQHK